MMTVLTRVIAPAAVLAALLATGLVTGCSSASSGSGAVTAATATPAAVASSAAAPPASAVIPPSGTSGTPAGAVPATTVQAWPGVYLAESQDPRGTTAREPGCAAGCPLSGDGTIVLWNMTWSRWDDAEAVGTGTEKIESCNPDCASGGQYSVQVKVTLTQPVKDCGDGTYFWTHAAFTWPAGLPAALSGGNAPINPWDWPQLRAAAKATCG